MLLTLRRKQAASQRHICLHWMMEVKQLLPGSVSPRQRAGPRVVSQSGSPAAELSHQTAGSPRTRSSLLRFEAAPPREQLSAVNCRDLKLSFKKKQEYQGKKQKQSKLSWRHVREQRSWKIPPKTPSGLHFELSHQTLSAD